LYNVGRFPEYQMFGTEVKYSGEFVYFIIRHDLQVHAYIPPHKVSWGIL